MKEKILVSACLVGQKCKYDSSDRKDANVVSLKKLFNVLPVCPEMLVGMKVPREPCEITGGSGRDVLDGKARVVGKSGDDKTPYFIAGAQQTLDLATSVGIKKAVFKSKSPSCGCGKIPDGSFSGKLVVGDGVTTALLKQNGILVYTEDDVSKL